MPKQLNLTDNLEQYIIDNSESLTEVQKEIIEYNISLGDQKRLQISVSQAQLLQTLIKISTKNQKGLIDTKYKWMSSTYPNYWVKHINEPENTSSSSYIQ